MAIAAPLRSCSLTVRVCVSVRLKLGRMNGGGPSSPQTAAHPGGGVSGRVAAVCPYIQVPAEGRKEAAYPLLAEPPQKHTPLSHVRSLSGWWIHLLLMWAWLSPGGGVASQRTTGVVPGSPPANGKVSDLDITLSEPAETCVPSGG